MNAEQFWNNVKPLIKQQNKTQESLASELNIPFGTFQGWITYKRLPDVVSAYKIAQALGVTMEYLVTGHDEQNDKYDRLKQAVLDAVHNN